MSMDITVFGAAGQVGGRVVAEALSRGHAVTAVVRTPESAARLPTGGRVRARLGDAANAADVAELSAGRDVVIGATRPAEGSEHELAAAAEGLLAGTRKTGVRLLLVGGAATLTVPGAGGMTVAEDPGFPEDLLPIARACAAQLAACRRADADGEADGDVDWAYLSPPGRLLPGERTGGYRLGTGELLVDDAGDSAISMEDLAVALLDEAERPKHRRMRFTVGY